MFCKKKKKDHDLQLWAIDRDLIDSLTLRPADTQKEPSFGTSLRPLLTQAQANDLIVCSITESNNDTLHSPETDEQEYIIWQQTTVHISENGTSSVFVTDYKR